MIVEHNNNYQLEVACVIAFLTLRYMRIVVEKEFIFLFLFYPD